MVRVVGIRENKNSKARECAPCCSRYSVATHAVITELFQPELRRERELLSQLRGLLSEPVRSPVPVLHCSEPELLPE